MKQQEEYKGIYSQLPSNVAINVEGKGKTTDDYYLGQKAMGNSSTNYLHTEENSQFFTSLEMIMNNLNSWVINFNDRNPIKADLQYLKTAIKNTIERGYVLVHNTLVTKTEQQETETLELLKKWKQEAPWQFYEKPKIPICIPLQLCPKCHGEGEISGAVITGEGHSQTICAGTKPCPICSGGKLIPMHVLNEQ